MSKRTRQSSQESPPDDSQSSLPPFPISPTKKTCVNRVGQTLPSMFFATPAPPPSSYIPPSTSSSSSSSSVLSPPFDNSSMKPRENTNNNNNNNTTKWSDFLVSRIPEFLLDGEEEETSSPRPPCGF